MGTRPARWLVLICVVLLVSCGGQSGTHTNTPAATLSVPQHPPKPVPPHQHPHPSRKHGPPLGSLPQTGQLPSAGTVVFHNEMRALWRGITRNSLAAALPAFFPEPAYLQVKAIPDAAGDWQARLVGDFRLDLGAGHALLAGSVAQSHLVGVTVPAAYAHWVTPGTCYNSVGYWEVPNARVVYRQGGALRSFGIASMISWRGVWYVVHLGAVLRPSAAGVVDSPSAGTGVSINTGTC